MNRNTCCKCQSTIPSDLISTRNTTWCRQCFIDQIHNKFFQGLKVAKEYCRPAPPPSSKRTQANNSNQAPQTDKHSSLVIHFKNDLSSRMTLQLIRNYLDTNQDRSTAKWKSPIDFKSIEVVWLNLGRASNYSSDSLSGVQDGGDEDENQQSRVNDGEATFITSCF